MIQTGAPHTSYELGPISVDDQEKHGWELAVTDTAGENRVIPSVAKMTLTHGKMGLELEYGMHPAGYDVWKFKEPNGGGAIATPYLIADGKVYVGLVDQNRPTAGGVISELPRGFSEPGETHDQTVQREVAEETGLQAVMGRFELIGSGINPNTAFFDTSEEGKGLRFYGLQVEADEVELVTDESGEVHYRFKQDLLEAAQAAGDKGAEKILTSRFVPLTEAVQSPDLMTVGGVGLLAGHLVGKRIMGVMGTEAPLDKQVAAELQ